MEPIIYLYFKGNCEEAMRFYCDLFGGELVGIFHNSDAEPGDRMPGDEDAVMNMAIRLGTATVMASDMPEDHYSTPQGFSVSMTPDSLAQAERWFEVLTSEGGEVSMPLGETFWAERFGMVRDRFGTPWMINYTGNKSQS